ncbi:Universal stress protein UspA [Caenispirillum salinarum AK4]|uniref:Universal stress protein UspA n=1 Tax=Caenispirillum salinarum AK4 TaxID=1238182 RepID=K9H578_9PROT|nr:universal stress protein [Caenispirillum salinarum]EKV32229.1 Universal stress protein UspA [Caenispirillum salinarum AK4]
MSDAFTTDGAPTGEAASLVGNKGGRPRTFLVVVDESEEMGAALLYASARARATGGVVALLKIIEPPEFAHFAAIGERMADENREAAEQTLHRFAAETVKMSGRPPVLYLREGHPEEEVRDLLETDGEISVLVLATGTGAEGPGPLVSALTGKAAGRIRVPVTIVPGNLTEDEILRLA